MPYWPRLQIDSLPSSYVTATSTIDEMRSMALSRMLLPGKKELEMPGSAQIYSLLTQVARG
ncbi:MAG: hypothetical protein NTY37_03175 [Methanothrix sp.]|nr:hypothetical protein [Methanothrix sp.]